MPEELVTTALQRAFGAQPPTPGRWCTPTAAGSTAATSTGNVYRQLLRDHQALRSQSRRGDCDDNAQAESRWSRLKTEMLELTEVLELRERPVFSDLADAQASVAEYFDYYNHERLHSRLNHQLPYLAHQQFLRFNALNCPA